MRLSTRCALRLRHARRGRSRRHVGGCRLRRPPRRPFGTGRCGDDPGLGHGRPFGPRALRELSRSRREADRECAPGTPSYPGSWSPTRCCCRTPRPMRARPRGHRWSRGPLPLVLGPCSPVPVHITNSVGTNVYPGDVAVSCPAILGGPIAPHGAITAYGDVGPAVIGRDEDATASGHLHPHRRRERAGPRAPRPRAAGRPGPSPAPAPGPGSGLATGSAPEPVARALAHPVGSHRVRGLPGRPGDPERHRPGSCGALARAAPLHGAPRQHRPNRVRTSGGPDRGGFPTLERRALRRPRRRRLRPQGCRRLPRTRRLLHVPSDLTRPPRTGPYGDGHRDLVQVRVPAHHRRRGHSGAGHHRVRTASPSRLGAPRLPASACRSPSLRRPARLEVPVRPPRSPPSPPSPRSPAVPTVPAPS